MERLRVTETLGGTNLTWYNTDDGFWQSFGDRDIDRKIVMLTFAVRRARIRLERSHDWNESSATDEQLAAEMALELARHRLHRFLAVFPSKDLPGGGE